LVEPAKAVPTPCGNRLHAVGFCVAGDFSTQTLVSGDAVTGFTVRGFEMGVMAIGASGLTVDSNIFRGSAGYGAAAFNSTGTTFNRNVAAGAGEAGFYIGDSPDANATITNNEAYGGFIGQFVRDAENLAEVSHNYWHDNCVGMVVLADAPGPAGAFTVQNNDIDHNTKACPANEEGPPVSGVGIALLGAHDVRILTNVITRNVPTGETAFQGGVAVGGQGPGSTAPMNNTVMNNTLHNNDPDINWDGSGTGNKFRGNSCDTSNPARICSTTSG
jgi:hypothetical protein